MGDQFYTNELLISNNINRIDLGGETYIDGINILDTLQNFTKYILRIEVEKKLIPDLANIVLKYL
jgi:hypothetical protein